jgi:hypothetical protein
LQLSGQPAESGVIRLAGHNVLAHDASSSLPTIPVAVRDHLRHESASGTWACHHANLNAREEFLGIGVEMHVPRPT